MGEGSPGFGEVSRAAVSIEVIQSPLGGPVLPFHRAVLRPRSVLLSGDPIRRWAGEEVLMWMEVLWVILFFHGFP